MKFSIYQTSRIGARKYNEDRLGYSYSREAAVMVLADGMGGHPEGDKAAELAIQSVSAHFRRNARPKVADPGAFLVEALTVAHQAILRYATAKGMLDNPRTTLVAALVQDGCFTTVHSGDSRLYWVRDGRLLMRTRDHSYLEKGAALQGGAAMTNRNILFTCLGSPVQPIFDVTPPAPLLQGDRLLLCSDGMWGSLSDDEIALGMAATSINVMVNGLADMALERGGRHCDNVSILALEWETPDAFEQTMMVHTDTVLDGDFATTIQSLEPEDLPDPLDDDEIERSINEINAAIRRSAARRPI